jgi:hypothetical protein
MEVASALFWRIALLEIVKEAIDVSVTVEGGVTSLFYRGRDIRYNAKVELVNLKHLLIRFRHHSRKIS